VVTLTGTGTPEAYWRSVALLGSVPRWTPAARRVIVVAPHPDDEVLGAGGALAQLARVGSEVTVVAVTDGEASHPGRSAELRERRATESERALALLGVKGDRVRIGQPDGHAGIGLADQLARCIGSGDLVLAPWEHDGHPDHDAVGAAARQASARAGGRLLEYLVWAWHWARAADLPWERAMRADMDPATNRCKAEAVACFESQLEGPDPILPSHVLDRLLRPFELFLQ
jgi:LmbE family N-acetylglucosaminyl deacetylase